jgi:hypothetical protein
MIAGDDDHMRAFAFAEYFGSEVVPVKLLKDCRFIAAGELPPQRSDGFELGGAL